MLGVDTGTLMIVYSCVRVMCSSRVQAEPEAFVAEVDAASADAVVMVGLLRRLARPAAFLEVRLWLTAFMASCARHEG